MNTAAALAFAFCSTLATTSWAQETDLSELLPDEVLSREIVSELAPTLDPEPSPRMSERGRTFLDFRWRPEHWSWRVTAATSVGDLRVRLDDQQRRSFGCVLGGGAWRLGVGGLRLDHGYGLIAFGAGRWRSLSPLQRLLGFRDGVASYAGSEAERSFHGASVGIKGRVQLDVLKGRLRDSKGFFVADVQAATLAWDWREGRLSVLGLQAGEWQGASLGLASDYGKLEFRCEAAGARRGIGEGAVVAVCAGATWRPAHRWHVEAAASAGDELGSPMADGLPLSAGDQGRGWALRMVAPLARRWRGGLLLWSGTRSANRDESPVWGGRQRLLLVLTGKPSDYDVRVRLGRDRERSWGWDNSAPWSTPDLLLDRGYETWGADIIHKTRPEVSLALRHRRRREPGAEVARGMARIRLQVTSGAWGQLVLTRTVAWGDALDLVYVDTPARGLSVLRHARHLHQRTSLGWSGHIFSLRSALEVETGILDEAGRDFGIRLRIWRRGYAF